MKQDSPKRKRAASGQAVVNGSDGRTPSIWRVLLGFVSAPLFAAVLYVAGVDLIGRPTAYQFSLIVSLRFLVLVCIVAYALTLILGVPAYLALRRVVRPSLWAASLVGGVIAFLPFWVIDARPTYRGYLNDASFLGGVFMAGAVAGAVFYFIVARKTDKRWRGDREISS